jgi:hypothetical protein
VLDHSSVNFITEKEGLDSLHSNHEVHDVTYERWKSSEWSSQDSEDIKNQESFTK